MTYLNYKVPTVQFPSDFYRYYGESMEGLNWLYINGSPVLLGIKGRMFIVELIDGGSTFNSGYTDYYLCPKVYRVVIRDYCTGDCVGISDFDAGFASLSSNYSDSKLATIKKSIEKFIISNTMEPTDFYK